jgi:aryl-alcohol dehydrogenase-like predicted oxidoreductase
LKRLGVDKIDLYLAHRVDGKTPIEKTIEAMVELKKDGKIDYLGLCEVSANTLRRAHKVHPITAIELEFSPFTLDIESEQTGLLKTCRELGVAVIAYSPLGRGMLTGRFKSIADFEEGDARSFLPRFSAENLAGNLKLVKDNDSFCKQEEMLARSTDSCVATCSRRCVPHSRNNEH